jgi:hypothetical protein
MQGFVPQTNFAPNAPIAYTLDPMGGMQQMQMVNGQNGMPNYPENVFTQVNEVSQSGQAPGLDLSTITEEELGQLSAVWQYQSLNLDFINPQP